MNNAFVNTIRLAALTIALSRCPDSDSVAQEPNPAPASFELPLHYKARARVLPGQQKEAAQKRAEVRLVEGPAEFAAVGGRWQALQPGAALRSGAMIRTPTNSTVELFLGDAAGVVRIMPESKLILESLKLDSVAGQGTNETELFLESGGIAATVKEMPADSKYEIKVSDAIVRPRGAAHFELNANGFFNLLEGAVWVVYKSGNSTVTSDFSKRFSGFLPASNRNGPQQKKPQPPR